MKLLYRAVYLWVIALVAPILYAGPENFLATYSPREVSFYVVLSALGSLWASAVSRMP